MMVQMMRQVRIGTGHRLVAGTALFSDDVGEALHLVLGAAEGSDAALDELACALVLRVADELHGAALVGREPGDLADDRADHLDALALATLAVRRAGSKHAALSGVAAVDAPDETCNVERRVKERGVRLVSMRTFGEVGGVRQSSHGSSGSSDSSRSGGDSSIGRSDDRFWSGK